MTETRTPYRTTRSSRYEDAFAAHLHVSGTPPAVREYMFHPSRRWRFDFAWPEQLVALEIDGATWANGRHTRGDGYAKDCIKYAEAAVLGWRVLRMTGDQVEDGTAIKYVRAMLGLEWGL